MHCFDKLTDRRGSNSMKWDEAVGDVIPMWVADMDFETAPPIIEALRQRVDHGVFGYTLVPESYYEATIDWFSRRHGWTIRREWMQYTSGVVPATSCCIKALTAPGQKVLTLTPAYNCFFSSIRNNGCLIEESPLRAVADSFEIDFDDVERRCHDPQTRLLLLCNPHNPSGRVWTRAELLRLGEICLENGVVVISDEIHCELTLPGYAYTPFGSLPDHLAENSITLSSPSKSFNTAGLQIANIICRNPEWRRLIDRAINDNEVCDVNPFGVIALQAAYNHGEHWLDDLRQYLADNYAALLAFMAEQLPEVKIARLEGTYLVWADVSGLGFEADELSRCLKDEAGVWMTSGSVYHDPAPGQHLRINIACPRSRMMQGLERMAHWVKQHSR